MLSKEKLWQFQMFQAPPIWLLKTFQSKWPFFYRHRLSPSLCTYTTSNHRQTRTFPSWIKMRVLQFLIVLLGGLVAAQQQALMDYLERRLLAIEVSLRPGSLCSQPHQHIQNSREVFLLETNAHSISSTNTFPFRWACVSLCDYKLNFWQCLFYYFTF